MLHLPDIYKYKYNIGDYTLATNALAREYSRHASETLARSQGIDGGDECDSDDDAEDITAAATNEELILEEEEKVKKSGPVIDEDGFETVGTGRKNRKPR